MVNAELAGRLKARIDMADLVGQFLGSCLVHDQEGQAVLLIRQHEAKRLLDRNPFAEFSRQRFANELYRVFPENPATELASAESQSFWGSVRNWDPEIFEKAQSYFKRV